MTTRCAVFGLVFLVLTNLTIIIAFATPNWIHFRIGSSQGLWAQCRAHSCVWVLEDNYTSTIAHIDVSSGWWIATQGLMCFGLSLSLFSLLFATIAICFDCKGCNTSQVISGLLLMCFLNLGVAAVVFGACAYKQNNVKINLEQNDGSNFGWSFWLDTAAAVLAMFTSVIYLIEGRASCCQIRGRTGRGTQPGGDVEKASQPSSQKGDKTGKETQGGGDGKKAGQPSSQKGDKTGKETQSRGDGKKAGQNKG